MFVYMMSLTTILEKKGQMDMHIQYWDTSLNTVKTRCYNSQFIGKAAAKDVLKTSNVSMVWMKISYFKRQWTAQM